MSGRRIICVSLPFLAIENWYRHHPGWPDDQPLALMIEAAHGPVIHSANPAARRAGVRAGARTADMHAFCPALCLEPADLADDSTTLMRLALWARRWGPLTAPDRSPGEMAKGTADGGAGLVIDATGVAHLFGGEPAMLADIQARFTAAGLTTRVAIAPTWGAAWALTWYGEDSRNERAICHDPRELDELPVEALRLTGAVCLLLRRLGLKTLGDLHAIPRLSLMRRFARAGAADHPLIRLDQVMGLMAEPIGAQEPPPLFQAAARLAEPVMDPRDWLPELTRDLCDQMAAKDQGCRRLRLSVFRVDGERRDLHVACAAPVRDLDHLLQLWGDRLGQLDPGFGFDLIILTALATEDLHVTQPGLDGKPDAASDLACLADRLVARFGAGRVARPIAVTSHIPERAEADAPPLAATGQRIRERPDRPLRMFHPAQEIRALYTIPDGPPLRFIWRRQVLSVTRHAGPERIAPEWWRDRPGTRLRDYFQIEDELGRRLWIYRDGLAEDGRGGAPRWFLQGVFA